MVAWAIEPIRDPSVLITDDNDAWRSGRWVPAVMMTAHPTDVPPEEVEDLQIRSVLSKPADRRQIVTIGTRVVRWR